MITFERSTRPKVRFKPKEIDVNLMVTDAQEAFLKSTKRGNIIHAGVGSGKSLILCRKAIFKALQRRKFGLISFSYRTLYDVILATLIEDLNRMGFKEGRQFKFNKNDMILSLFGQPILLRSGDRPDSLRGLNLDDFGIDEAREFRDGKLFNILIARIRLKEDAQWFIVSTTRGKDWVFDLSKDKDNVAYFTQSTYDNLLLPQSYLKELESRYTTEFRRQEMLAEIVELGAGIIKAKWFNKIPYVTPVGGVRYWDLAVSTTTQADYSCGARATYGQTGTNKFCIHNMIHGKFEYPDLRRKIISAAHADGKDCIIGVEEAGQQKGFIDDLKQCPELAGYVIRARRPVGDKLNRAMPWAAKAEAGDMDICEGHWNEEFFSEVNDFTADDTHLHDDFVDGTSGAYMMVAHSGMVVGARIAI